MSETGYIEDALDVLNRFKATIWSNVKIQTIKGTEIKGLILPAPEGTKDVIYIKLPNGYNIALDIKKIENMEVLGVRKVEYKVSSGEIKYVKTLPTIFLLGAGGTIASRVEYETGAVKPAFSQRELLNAVPEIGEIANVKTENVFNIFSEDMQPKHWIILAKKIADKIEGRDVSGIIITHGTDTMQYTASALAFMLNNLPVPIVLTGAQRSSDRPASDSAVNLIASALVAAKTDIGEVMVVMHSSPNDLNCYAHRGVRVRKMHSSRRDAFKTIGDLPLALIDVDKREIEILKHDYIKTAKNRDEFYAKPVFEEKTAIVYIYPNITESLIHILIDHGYRGITLIGTGLGHVPEYLIPVIKRGVDEGVFFAMTTQCIWGPVAMNVYERGRRLRKIGVIPADGMLPEVAYVKMGWLLAQYDERKKIIELMKTNIKREILVHERIDRYIC
ncbi:MAG: Glu-tRNA(Gln) amidotransferase subunit GatD [Candidatus Njordarchaeia archaeon]